jgi:hypothetical protein
MPQIICRRIKLKPGSLPKVREWVQVIHDRQQEAFATLKDEGVFIESAFLDHASDGDYLIYYLRAESLSKASAVVAQSQHDIDRYHRQFQQETWESGTTLELLIDLEVPRHGDAV